MNMPESASMARPSEPLYRKLYAIASESKYISRMPFGVKYARYRSFWVFVKRNFLGAGKSYMIKGKQA